MNLLKLIGAIGVVVLVTSTAFAQSQPPAAKKRLLLVTQSKGFEHDVVKQKDGKPSLVEQTFAQLSEKTGLFTVEATRDASLVNPQKLKDVDIVVFYTTGDLPMKPGDLDAWVKGGGSFLGIHPATDTFHKDAIYPRLINGTFNGHPWGAKDTITLKVLDPEHPTAKPWTSGDTFPEEIYQFRNFDPTNVRVILGLDMEKTAKKRPYFVPIAWCKQEGDGKVYYTSLGHRDDVWTNPKYQDHLVAALRWLSGAEQANATPNPDVSAKENELAKQASPATAPAPAKL